MLMPNANLNEPSNPVTAAPEPNSGVYLDDLLEGAVLEVETIHHHYTIINRAQGEALISGHPVYCPEPTQVRIEGSSWSGYMLKSGFIGLGMRLTFQLPSHRTIRTSPIVQIRTTQPLAEYSMS